MGPEVEGISLGQEEGQRKGTQMCDVMFAGGRQAAREAPLHLQSFWDTSGQTSSKARQPGRFADRGRWVGIAMENG